MRRNEKNSPICTSCGKELLGHLRCRPCDILMHAANESMVCKSCGIQHGLICEGSHSCTECEESRGVEKRDRKNAKV